MYSLVLELVRRGLETIDGFSYVDKYSAVFSETLTNKFSLTIPEASYEYEQGNVGRKYIFTISIAFTSVGNDVYSRLRQIDKVIDRKYTRIVVNSIAGDDTKKVTGTLMAAGFSQAYRENVKDDLRVVEYTIEAILQEKI